MIENQADYTIAVGPLREEPTVARSSRLDAAMHGGDTVEVVGVDADETGWAPTPFQVSSWTEYLGGQAVVRAALQGRLREEFAGLVNAVAGQVWQAFTIDSVVLLDKAPPLRPRAERRGVLRLFTADAAAVEGKLDVQERLSTADKRSAYDVLLNAGHSGDRVWIASFRDGELVRLLVEG